MIAWVARMFGQDQKNIIFITREEHLQDLPYVAEILQGICAQARIFSIKDWQKKGPVFDVLRAADAIDDKQPVMVSYCDYYMHFDYEKFKQDLRDRACAGCVPCYSGFHPNLLPVKNLYASCKVDAQENLQEIREKFSWEDDKSKTRHSPGLYYFKTGAICKEYSQMMVDADDQLYGEYYYSLVYNHMVRAGLDVWCPVNVRHFCQWGTPEDLDEYLFWMNAIKKWGSK